MSRTSRRGRLICLATGALSLSLVVSSQSTASATSNVPQVLDWERLVSDNFPAYHPLPRFQSMKVFDEDTSQLVVKSAKYTTSNIVHNPLHSPIFAQTSVLSNNTSSPRRS